MIPWKIGLLVGIASEPSREWKWWPLLPFQPLENVEVFFHEHKERKNSSSAPKTSFPGYFFAFLIRLSTFEMFILQWGRYIVRRNEIPVHIPPQVMIALRFISPAGVVEIRTAHIL